VFRPFMYTFSPRENRLPAVTLGSGEIKLWRLRSK
jgi:hypothetical protein